jgi:putative ABC transport system permease protein
LPAYLAYAIHEVRRRKIRTLANVMGYVFAVAFMIALVSFGQAYSAMETNILRGIGTHFAVFIPARTVSPGEFAVGPFFKGVYTGSFNMNVVEAVRALPGVDDAAPYLMFVRGNLTIGGIDISRLATNTTAVSPENVVEGRYLEATDLDGVLLDEVSADLMRLKTGDNIDAFNHTFRIVGIVNPKVNSQPAGVADMYALIDVVRDVMQSDPDSNYLMGFGDTNVILVEASHAGEVEEVNAVKQSVLETLESHVGEKGSLAGYGCYAPARIVVSITEENAWIVSLIVVISVTLFSLKSQFGAVVERTNEIGILKAIGWGDSDVMKQILVESVLQGLIGGLAGICLGYALAFLFPLFGIMSAEGLILAVSPLLIIGGLTAALLGGIVAGVFPAWQAAKLQPAEALRRF